MKIIIFTLLFFVSSMIYSQGNLQFNQVITYSFPYTSSLSGGFYQYSSPTYTVPNNKVWKVEKFLMNVTGSTSVGSLIINNGYPLTSSDVNSGPVWLKAGDVVIANRSVSGGGNYSGYYFISIIEYNIIPE